MNTNQSNNASAVREAGQNKIKTLVEEFGSNLQDVWDACPFVNDQFSVAFVSIRQIKERSQTDAAAVLNNPAHEPAYRECVEQWLLAVSYFANRHIASANWDAYKESGAWFVAPLHPSGDGSHYASITQRVTEEDARLIASAPDLVALVQRVADCDELRDGQLYADAHAILDSLKPLS